MRYRTVSTLAKWTVPMTLEVSTIAKCTNAPLPILNSSYLFSFSMKAEKVIREQLAVQETPSLWCHLGDVLEKPECYQKAWELSNCRYARAQRSLGYHYLYKAQVGSF